MASYVPPTFTPPTKESILQDPAYQARLQSGTDALNRAAAAKGVLRTGGTLKDILGYGQDLASQESDKAYDRAMQLYGLQSQAAKDKWQADWEQHVFANTPHGGGGGGGGDDLLPPPEAPDYGPPEGYEDPYAMGGMGGGGMDPSMQYRQGPTSGDVGYY